MNRLSVVTILSALFLTACASDEARQVIKPIDDLSLACTIVACECVNKNAGIFTREINEPIIWSKEGRASCPADFRLRRTDQK